MLVIDFDSGIYNLKAVKKAISDYSGLAVFSCRPAKGRIQVRVDKIKNKELEPVFLKEFSNYVLALVGALK